MAAEIVEHTRAKILVETSTAILAQTNLLPKSALSLLSDLD